MFEVKKNCESMIFIRDKYKNEFEMWESVSLFIQMLMINDNICVIRNEGEVIVVEYEHNEYLDYFGGPSPVWLEEDEQELLYNYREKKYRNSHREEDQPPLFALIIMLNYHTAAEYVKHNYKYKNFCRKLRAFII